MKRVRVKAKGPSAHAGVREKSQKRWRTLKSTAKLMITKCSATRNTDLRMHGRSAVTNLLTYDTAFTLIMLADYSCDSLSYEFVKALEKAPFNCVFSSFKHRGWHRNQQQDERVARELYNPLHLPRSSRQQFFSCLQLRHFRCYTMLVLIRLFLMPSSLMTFSAK